MLTKIKDNEPTYLYKLENGVSDLKGGVSVLKKLNYPDYILNETINILKNFN